MILTVTRPTRPYADLSDITSKEIVDRGWQEVAGEYVAPFFVQFAVNLTAAEEAAIRRRLTTGTSVEEELHRLGVLALVTDRDFRDTTAPHLLAAVQPIITDAKMTPPETAAHVRDLAAAVQTLTKQVQSLSSQNVVLLRLVMRLLDAAD